MSSLQIATTTVTKKEGEEREKRINGGRGERRGSGIWQRESERGRRRKRMERRVGKWKRKHIKVRLCFVGEKNRKKGEVEGLVEGF
ncbi:hypothetical protein TIFTF001_056742 [Ficus carica]|uniref:Uncharacterized protein n=1 Tax=Ficus carica TaxID=3494 RepID=A0AA88JFH9_FICCA|nr:hypothetical protein TIFTF001_056741 [Ficus carica]GMN75185.1 hypothetical protein TIFTF001_056742 [Ficus carica]